MIKYTTIGAGNTGMKIATLFDKKALLLSTAEQDTSNYKDFKVSVFATTGAGKRFSQGNSMWQENTDKLERFVADIPTKNVVLIAGLGGGSGSSSLHHLVDFLLSRDKKVLVVGILPFKQESIPPLANAVQSVNSLMPYVNKASVMLVDNTVLLERHNNDWSLINEDIVRRINTTVNLLSLNLQDKYSPVTLDESELESVVFGGGFIDISSARNERGAPVFDYGAIDKTTKNVLFAFAIDEKVDDKKVDAYQSEYTNILKDTVSKAKNARMIPGIIRAKLKSATLTTNLTSFIFIASGMNIDKHLKKIMRLRDAAMKKTSVFNEKYEGADILTEEDSSTLDV